MDTHKKNTRAEALKASLSALVVSSAAAGAAQPPDAPATKSSDHPPEKSNTAEPPEESEAASGQQFIRLGLSLFPKDFDQISSIMAEGLKRGQRLNQSQAIRLALRSLNLAKLATADMEAVRLDDRRRKSGKSRRLIRRIK
jgi:hypothetical protein